jgi:hypothetical protein
LPEKTGLCLVQAIKIKMIKKDSHKSEGCLKFFIRYFSKSRKVSILNLHYSRSIK